MVIGESGMLNLWDTNGRRKDILNAISTYLTILTELDTQYPNETWGNYPASIKQYEFYRRAIEASNGVLRYSDALGDLPSKIEECKHGFESRDAVTITMLGLCPYDAEANPTYALFERDIEAKARHFTSCLVKLGFITKDREITTAGKEFVLGKTRRDALERMLPIDDINLIVLRQLMKLRVFHKPEEGACAFYSPMAYSMQLLLRGNSTDHNEFKRLVVAHETKPTPTPLCFLNPALVPASEFDEYINNRKSGSVHTDYYRLYVAFYDFMHNQNVVTYKQLITAYQSVDETTIKRAFFVANPLKFKKNKNFYSFTEFLTNNARSIWFTSTTDFNTLFFTQFIATKMHKLCKDYGDTLYRLLAASGVFGFSKALPELLYNNVFEQMLAHSSVLQAVNGVVTKEECDKYETETFGQSHTISEILELNQEAVIEITDSLQTQYGNNVKAALYSEKAQKVEAHVQRKYPKDKVIELLGYFSNRDNDEKIKKYVNPSADVPTIYEYVVALAWYYISDRNYPLYNSLNLTLDGDYEPVHHAGGGAGDIVIEYPDEVVMLEATLMNQAAQKRGEWEPVLRHSINLKTANEDKKVTTFFVADALDMNTTNIWRAVASVPLQATNTNAQTDHVYIMPFTNAEIAYFLQNNIKGQDILTAVRKSYDSLDYSFDNNWRSDIMSSLVA